MKDITNQYQVKILSNKRTGIAVTGNSLNAFKVD